MFGLEGTCPGCSLHEDNLQHALVCKQPSTSAHRISELQLLEQHLKKAGMSPAVLQGLLHSFDPWVAPRLPGFITICLVHYMALLFNSPRPFMKNFT
jgi:hypothetical protein